MMLMYNYETVIQRGFILTHKNYNPVGSLLRFPHLLL